MLRAAILCPDRELGSQLQGRLEAVTGVSVVRNAQDYLSKEDLGRLVRAQVPEVLFVSVEQLPRALELVTEAESLLDGVQFVAVGRAADPRALLELMRVGVREFLAYPIEERPLLEALVRVKDVLERKPVQAGVTDKVFAFLPSKSGVGATTIAVNTAVAASRQTEGSCLLVDADRVGGMVRFLLQLENGYSLDDALERALQLDENLWPQLVTAYGSLDVVHSGTLRPDIRVETGQMRQLVDFARRNYEQVYLDLPGRFDAHETEAMQECKKLFVVVTPEVPSLHLAKEKISYLTKIGLGDRIEILLNRHPKRPLIQKGSVEELLGKPVAMALGNHYHEVHRALTKGKPVNEQSELGREFSEFARRLGDRKADPGAAKTIMSDLLSLLPGSLSLLSTAKKPVN